MVTVAKPSCWLSESFQHSGTLNLSAYPSCDSWRSWHAKTPLTSHTSSSNQVWKNTTASSGVWQILLVQNTSYHILCKIQEAMLRITIYLCKNLQRLPSSLSWQVNRLFILDPLFTITHYIHCSILAICNCLQWRPSVNTLGRKWLILTGQQYP